jgi:hypothetical protein
MLPLPCRSSLTTRASKEYQGDISEEQQQGAPKYGTRENWDWTNAPAPSINTTAIQPAWMF